MRILFVTFCSLIASLIIFWTVKFWGRSQHYVAYEHPVYVSAQKSGLPLRFLKPGFANLDQAINSRDNLFLDVASTVDQAVVIPKKQFGSRAIRYLKIADIQSDVYLLSDLKEKLRDRIIIFNIFENAQAGHAIFLEELKKMGWDKGENFIVTSPYEAIAKALKEIAPTFLFASTQPEILRLVAMDSMMLVEAVSLRADIIIHPLRIKNQFFYKESILEELKHRHKQFIVGPIAESDWASAEVLKPFAILVEK